GGASRPQEDCMRNWQRVLLVVAAFVAELAMGKSAYAVLQFRLVARNTYVAPRTYYGNTYGTTYGTAPAYSTMPSYSTPSYSTPSYGTVPDATIEPAAGVTTSDFGVAPAAGVSTPEFGVATPGVGVAAPGVGV